MKPRAKDNINNSFTFKALGTEFIILTPTELSAVQKNSILKYVENFETDYSRFRKDSKLSKLNISKKLDNPSLEMQKMLKFAVKTWETSGGLFNISIGGVLESQGYGQINDKASTISKNLAKDIFISPQKIEINPNIWLDFGGFGKGWFIDKLSDLLVEWNFKDYIINGGGDIRVGSQQVKIELENPLNSDESIGAVLLKNQAFGASSNLKRTWKSANNKSYSHIQRPDGEKLKNNILMTATISDTALRADVLATCLLLDTGSKNIAELKTWGDYCFILKDLRVFRTANFHLV